MSIFSLLAVFEIREECEIEMLEKEKQPNFVQNDDSRLANGKSAIRQAGDKMSRRVAGMLSRESSRLMDQFPILEERLSQNQVEEILWEHFKPELDKTAEKIMLRAEARKE